MELTYGDCVRLRAALTDLTTQNRPLPTRFGLAVGRNVRRLGEVWEAALDVVRAAGTSETLTAEAIDAAQGVYARLLASGNADAVRAWEDAHADELAALQARQARDAELAREPANVDLVMVRESDLPSDLHVDWVALSLMIEDPANV